jgi:drug/metabolite transporter (DMT)-like permease
MDPKLYGLVVAISFGLNPVVLKLGFARSGRSKVDAAVMIGLIVAVPIYVAVVPFSGGLSWEQVTPLALVCFALGGILGAGLGRHWLYAAIHLIGAAPATAIKNGAPLISTILAVLLLGEQVGLIQWVAILAIIAGITFVTWKPGEGRRQMLNVGVLAALAAAGVYGVRPLFLKYGLDIADLPVTAALVGAIAALLYAALLARPKDLRSEPMGRTVLVLFVVSGALQAVGFLALTFGLSGGDVSIVYPITSTAPIFTLGFTRLMLRGTEEITWRIALGVLAVTAGVIFL